MGREIGRLGVQRVEDRLDQDDVGTAVDQPANLLGIGDAQVVEGHGAEAGIVDVGRDGGGAVGRAQRPGDEAAAPVLALGPQQGALGEPRPVAVQLVDRILHAVVGLGDGGGREGVGLDDVGARHRIGVVDRLDGVGLGQRQEVVVALEVAFAGLEAMAPEVALLVVQALDLGAHGAVEHQDALARRRGQRPQDLRAVLAALDHASRAVGEQGVDVLAHAVLRSVTCSYKDIVI